MRLKKAIAVLLAMVSCLSLAACGDNSSEVIGYLNGNTWFVNGGGDAVVNRITFTEEEALISQIFYDGNGKHIYEETANPFEVDDSNVTITLVDGSEIVIPYTVEAESIKLGTGEYFTIQEVDAALQGSWNSRESNFISVLNMKTEGEYNIVISNGAMEYEHANLVNGSTTGEYYYYGPHSGTYVINENGLSAEIKEDYSFGFGIIDGQVVLLRYNHVCQPGDGLKGPNGYSF